MKKLKDLLEGLVSNILFPITKLLCCATAIYALAWVIDFIHCKW